MILAAFLGAIWHRSSKHALTRAQDRRDVILRGRSVSSQHGLQACEGSLQHQSSLAQLALHAGVSLEAKPYQRSLRRSVSYMLALRCSVAVTPNSAALHAGVRP